MTKLHVIGSMYFVAPPELSGPALRLHMDSHVQQAYNALTEAFMGDSVTVTYGLGLDEENVPLHTKVYVDGVEDDGFIKEKVIATISNLGV